MIFWIPFEHKYDKVFRNLSHRIVPSDLSLPSGYEVKIFFFLSDLALLLLSTYFIRYLFRDRGVKWLGILFGVALFSIITSPLSHYIVPYIRLLQLLSPILLYSLAANAFTQEEKFGERALVALWVAGLVHAGIGIFQYAIQHPLGLRFMNEPQTFHAIILTPNASRWIWETLSQGEGAPLMNVFRATGCFSHPNVLAGFLSLSLLISYSLSLKNRLYLFSIPPLFLALLLTYSRGGLYAWAIGSLLWFGLHWKHLTHDRPSLKRAALLLTLPLLLSGLFIGKQLYDRGFGVQFRSGFSMKSDQERVELAKIALDAIKEKPLTGVGFNHLSTYRPGHFCAVHNIYLLLAAEVGLLGAAAFGFFLITLFSGGGRSPPSSETLTLLSLLASLLIVGMFDHYPIVYQQVRLVFFLLAGLLVRSRKLPLYN